MFSRLLCIALISLATAAASAADLVSLPGMVRYGDLGPYSKVADDAMNACAVRGGEECMLEGSRTMYYVHVGSLIDGDLMQLRSGHMAAAEKMANSTAIRGKIDARIKVLKNARYYVMDGGRFSVDMLNVQDGVLSPSMIIPEGIQQGFKFTRKSLDVAMPQDKAELISNIRAYDSNNNPSLAKLHGTVYFKVDGHSEFARTVTPIYAEYSLDTKQARTVLFTIGSPSGDGLQDRENAQFTAEGLAFLAKFEKGSAQIGETDTTSPAASTGAAVSADPSSAQVNVKIGDVVGSAGKAIGGLLNGIFSSGK